MKKYLSSRYNIVAERCGRHYVWNTLSGAVAVLDDEIERRLFSDEIDLLQDSVIQELAQNYIVIPDGFDEYEYVLKRARGILTEGTPTDLHVVIAPTLRCNYHCEYCFESKRTSFSDMERSIAEETWRFVKEKIEGNCKLGCFHVTWFGGEPLLRLDIIRWLSSHFIEMCESRDVIYRASLITNGRYLDADAVDVLIKDRIKRTQISLDGTEGLYCQVKHASKSDYYATISNVERAVQKGLPIVLRINIRNNDFSSAYKLADLFLGEMSLDGMIKLYPAFVSEGDVAGRKSLYADFVIGEKRFAQYIFDRYSRKSYYNKLSFAHGVACSLSCENNFCIGPKGELYKCEHHFGRENFIVGDIFSNNRARFAQEYEHVCYSSMQKETCKNCPIFPICLGGCPNSNLLGEENFDCKSFVGHLIDCQLRKVESQ